MWRVCFWLVRTVSWKSRWLFAVFLFRTEPRLRGTGRTDQSTSEYIFCIIIVTYTVKAPKSSPSCCPFSQVYLAYSSTLPFLSLVSQSNLQGTVSGVYRQGSEMLLDTRQLNTSGLTGPLYWRLPAQFEGNQVLLSKLMPDTVSLLPLYLQPNRLTDSCCCPHCLNMCFGCLNSHRMI